MPDDHEFDPEGRSRSRRRSLALYGAALGLFEGLRHPGGGENVWVAILSIIALIGIGIVVGVNTANAWPPKEEPNGLGH